MSAPQSTVADAPFSPADMATEIVATYRQFCLLMGAPDDFHRYSPQPALFSLPAIPELAAFANVILEALGRDVGDVDMTQADACVFSLPRYIKRDLTDMPPPRSAEALSELLDRVTARLEAIAWESNGLRALGAWCDENPNEGVQVCSALRSMAKYSLGGLYGGRD